MKFVHLGTYRLDVDLIEGYYPEKLTTITIVRKGVNELLHLEFENSAARDLCLRDFDAHLKPTR